ncbi:MAG: hypothetical protein ACREIN_01005 [Candidatus Methylomirabilaceae bacterium]
MSETKAPVPQGGACCPSDKAGDPEAGEQRRVDGETGATDLEDAEPPMLSKDQAIAEVKRWFERYKIDPNQIFARAGDLIVRYGDLIPHLEQETDEGRLLLRAISRGQVIRKQRESPGGPVQPPR